MKTHEIIVAGYVRIGGGGRPQPHFQDYVYSEEGIAQALVAHHVGDGMRILINEKRHRSCRDCKA